MRTTLKIGNNTAAVFNPWQSCSRKTFRSAQAATRSRSAYCAPPPVSFLCSASSPSSVVVYPARRHPRPRARCDSDEQFVEDAIPQRSQHPGKDHYDRRFSPYRYWSDAADRFTCPAQRLWPEPSVQETIMDMRQALIPLAFTKEQLQERAGDFDYPGLARLKPGISAAQAQAELNGLQHSFSATLSADEKMTLIGDSDSVPAIPGGQQQQAAHHSAGRSRRPAVRRLHQYHESSSRPRRRSPAGDGGGFRAGSQSKRPAAGLHARSCACWLRSVVPWEFCWPR